LSIEFAQPRCAARTLEQKLSAAARAEGRVLDAEGCLKEAYRTDVRPLPRELREEMGLDPDPLTAFGKSGGTERAARTRGES
jgi:L-rhamnose isomerase/sugar isomerase